MAVSKDARRSRRVRRSLAICWTRWSIISGRRGSSCSARGRAVTRPATAISICWSSSTMTRRTLSWAGRPGVRRTVRAMPPMSSYARRNLRARPRHRQYACRRRPTPTGSSSYGSPKGPCMKTPNPNARWNAVERWLRVAERDRRSVLACLAADPPLHDSAAFHCQQAVEKLLKGF